MSRNAAHITDMTNIAPAAAAARESARTAGGQFGEQQHTEAPSGVVRPMPKPEDFHQDFADAVRTADKAANGDSNDDEHDALIDLNDAAEGYLEAHRRAGTLDLDSTVTGPDGRQQPSFHSALKQLVDRTEEVIGDDGSNDDEFDHLHNFKEVVRSQFGLPDYDDDDDDEASDRCQMCGAFADTGFPFELGYCDKCLPQARRVGLVD